MPKMQDVDLANAEVELAQAKLYKANEPGTRDANEGSADVSQLGAQGLSVVERSTDPDKNDPSLLRILYHAYDGRKVPVPDYMAPKLLAHRFPAETWVPSSWRGKRVWFLEPQTVETETQNLLCILHADQEPIVVAEITRAGLTPGRCTKRGITNIYSLETHMRLKHKNEWAAIQRIRTEAKEEDARSETRAQTEAIIRLAESLVKNGG